MTQNNLKIFSGRSNPLLAKQIAQFLDRDLGAISIRTFSDGELWVKYEENIRGHDVFIVQSTNGPSENIIELTLMVDAAVRASADTVTVVIPYFGYGRQDRKDQPRVPISSRVMIDILTAMGTDRIITMDLHSTQIQGFAKIPFDNLYSRSVLFDAIKDENLEPDNSVVLAPDIGSVKMSQGYAKNLGMYFALIDKRRYAPNKAEISHLIGDLNGMDVLIIDDMIDTAGTTVNAAEAALKQGAKSVTAVATHGVLSGPAMERLSESNIKKIIVTDTIAISKEKHIEKLKIVSVGNVFGEAVNRIHNGESVSALFEF
ncbi:MAG: ribose-phosphate pyrophosphokinase [Candidatus Marinimicrobia bacterium]|jgi:ribose-phosphate pyrophosphokinase|nr:ribose-phosphate pyrophosphokinase [Candidatus Neomarinimicrobiota bacterium]MEC7735871.1 ribose-phosphate pyrophosphokinase [Candidatus Neomarinimicrobiota bacterium]MEE3153517.1 ribose-phosphate pyrophosphokinase [Candidatus Neomarinimicrobiota bacterium]|tara:strand:- start:12100 stop:13047 length:948 start_codon:yes stop_codon:yes gene_type:complete